MPGLTAHRVNPSLPERSKRIAVLLRGDGPDAPVARAQYLTLGVITVLFLYLHLFHWPFTPIWRRGDQAIYMLNAVQMLGGKVLYRDLFQFNLPGTEVLCYLLFRCFGVDFRILSVSLLLADTASTLLVLHLSRRLLPGNAALLPPLVFLCEVLHFSLDGTHHTWSTLLVLAAIGAIAGNLGWIRLIAAGSLLGVAGLFTSSRGVAAVAGAALFLIWKFGFARQCARALAALVIPFCAVTGGTLFYLMARCGTNVIIQSLIVFPSHYFGLRRRSGGTWAFWYQVRDIIPESFHSGVSLMHGLVSALIMFLPYMLSAAAVIILAVALFGSLGPRAAEFRRSPSGEIFVLYALMGCWLVLGVVNSYLPIRAIAAIPFALILGTYWLTRAAGRRMIALASAASVVIGVLLLAQVYLHPLERLETPRGEVFMDASSYEYCSTLERLTHVGVGYLGYPDFNFILALDDPTPVPWITPDGFTRPEQVQAVLTSMEKGQIRFLEWNSSLEGHGGSDDNLSPVRAWVHGHYHWMASFDDGTEILALNSTEPDHP
jgi:hypothetical protein